MPDIKNRGLYYACKPRGLSAFSGERDSLIRCVGVVGEAGASYMNKCSLIPFPDVRYIFTQDQGKQHKTELSLL